MLPIIPEVIFIAEAHLRLEGEPLQRDALLIRHIVKVKSRITVKLIVDDELMKMGIGLAHNNLEDVVQFG